MEELTKKLEQLKDLIKAIRQTATPVAPGLPKLPTPKPPAVPSMTPSVAQAPKIGTGAGPNSKKDPRKVAQQIKDGSMSTKTQKVMLKTDSKTGQWSLEEIDKAEKPSDETPRYHIHNGTHKVTSDPMSISEINSRYGSVQRLESSGHRLHIHQPTTPRKPTIAKADSQSD